MCYVDLSKAATYISPKEEDSILRHIAADVENVLKEKIWNFSRSNSVDSLTSSLGYTVSHQSLVTDYILSSIRLDSKKFFDMATTSLMAEETPIIFKHAFISTCVKIATDENPMPWCPTIKQLYPFMCQILRRIFVQIAKAEMSAPVARSDISSATSGSRKTGNGSGDKTLFRIQNSEGALRCILKLFRLDPLTALKV
jgi:neurofibromin 1